MDFIQVPLHPDLYTKAIDVVIVLLSLDVLTLTHSIYYSNDYLLYSCLG